MLPPGQSRHTLAVPFHAPQSLHPVHVPHTDLIAAGSEGKVVACPSPGNGGDVAAGVWELTELLDRATLCVPEVDCVAQGNGQDVGPAPVQQVEICII